MLNERIQQQIFVVVFFISFAVYLVHYQDRLWSFSLPIRMMLIKLMHKCWIGGVHALHNATSGEKRRLNTVN